MEKDDISDALNLSSQTVRRTFVILEVFGKLGGSHGSLSWVLTVIHFTQPLIHTGQQDVCKAQVDSQAFFGGQLSVILECRSR